MDALVVSRESIEAYERRTGFRGIGEFFIRKGLFVLQEETRCENGAGSPRTTSSSTTTFRKEPNVVSGGYPKNVLVPAGDGKSGQKLGTGFGGGFRADR